MLLPCTRLCRFSALERPFTVICFLQKTTLLIATTSTQSANTYELAELATQLETYVKVLDLPDIKSRLIDFLATHRPALSLPGDQSGVTDRVIHRASPIPDTCPIYKPFYRLFHFQRQIAHDIVNDMLTEGIIQNSHSPWNSSLSF